MNTRRSSKAKWRATTGCEVFGSFDGSTTKSEEYSSFDGSTTKSEEFGSIMASISNKQNIMADF